ncbi:MAG: prepilin-type N-terminal cleavage/methylation domain-containing protein [Patescibacteria group bacterium]
MKKNSGFTLIEIILYVGIIAIIFAAIVPFTLNIINTGSKSAVQQEVTDNARFVSEKIKYEIRRTSAITSVSANSIVLGATTIDLLNGKIRINTIPLNSDNTTVSDLTFTRDNSNISFTLTVAANGVRQEYQSNISLRSAATVRGIQ